MKKNPPIISSSRPQNSPWCCPHSLRILCSRLLQSRCTAPYHFYVLKDWNPSYWLPWLVFFVTIIGVVSTFAFIAFYLFLVLPFFGEFPDVLVKAIPSFTSETHYNYSHNYSSTLLAHNRCQTLSLGIDPFSRARHYPFPQLSCHTSACMPCISSTWSRVPVVIRMFDAFCHYYFHCIGFALLEISKPVQDTPYLVPCTDPWSLEHLEISPGTCSLS